MTGKARNEHECLTLLKKLLKKPIELPASGLLSAVAAVVV